MPADPFLLLVGRSTALAEYRRTLPCWAKTIDAAVTDKLMFNGSRFEIDLCEKHSLELFAAVMAWADLGTKTGESGLFDRQVQAKAATVDLEPPKKALKAEPEPEPVAEVTPLRTVLADDPDLPLTASRWVLTAGAGSIQQGFHNHELRRRAGHPSQARRMRCQRTLWQHGKQPRRLRAVHERSCTALRLPAGSAEARA